MKLIPKHQNQKKPKKPAKSPRAGAHDDNHRGGPSKKQKVSETLANILNDGDLRRVAEVYREGLDATQRIWHENSWTDDKGRLRGKWVEVPDYKTRKACADMIAAYREGLPVQRQAILVQQFESMDQTRERVSHSPELLKAIGNLQKGGVVVEAGGEVIDVEMTVQKSGGQNAGVASEENDDE